MWLISKNKKWISWNLPFNWDRAIFKCPVFKSEGFGYQGLYGQYNLPQYDLVHGGGKDQNNSCRETMFKTSLN
ncbi:hypothetical protein [Mycoplasmopsis bovirhinis]|uniref:hypothetical protein n=1 Tax=Mycoplasmopsis bovirhinis TaxID=29553 RepID=UPI000E7449E6|nr:hypothetical protein [Mycoplasmopsis bovirhinis]